MSAHVARRIQRVDFIWVADSKLATEENLGKISAWKGLFVSVMPRTWKADGDYKTSHGYRLHWIRSTQKAEQDEETRTRRIHRALEKLRAIEPKLNAYNLKGRKQIVEGIESILKKRQCQALPIR